MSHPGHLASLWWGQLVTLTILPVLCEAELGHPGLLLLLLLRQLVAVQLPQHSRLKDNKIDWWTNRYMVFRKNCVFSQFTETPPSPTSLCETFKALNAMRLYSHSYRLLSFEQPISAECPPNDNKIRITEIYIITYQWRGRQSIKFYIPYGIYSILLLSCLKLDFFFLVDYFFA